MNNQIIFSEANRALAAGQYDQFLAYCAEHIKWERVGERTITGKADLAGYLKSAYDGLVFTTESYIKEHDVIVELGPIMLEKAGTVKRSSYCDVWKFEDGQILQMTSFVIPNSLDAGA